MALPLKGTTKGYLGTDGAAGDAPAQRSARAQGGLLWPATGHQPQLKPPSVGKGVVC